VCAIVEAGDGSGDYGIVAAFIWHPAHFLLISLAIRQKKQAGKAAV
jgi:hypothetical protein